MRKTIAVLAVFLYISAALLTASAQTSDPANTDSENSNLIGGLIGIIGLVAVFAVIGYAGYRMIKKWSSSQPE